MHVVEAEKYYQALLKEIPQAKRRIVLAAMIVVWGERTAPIFIMLQDALKRGVSVTILLDNYTHLTMLYGLRPRSSRTARVKQTFRALEDLGKNGAKVYTFGKLGFPPYKGRSHVKMTVIDDTSYSFGGVNFIDQNFAVNDYMLRSTKPEAADYLAKLTRRIGTNRPPLKDEEIELAPGTSMLFDGGQPKRSLIYERACELAAQAKRVWFVSQMAPSGQLATLLNENGATCFFNRPEQMLPIDSLGQAFDQQRYRTTNSYKASGYIHAKYLLAEMPSGQKALLSSSHNFSYRGVQFGTQETALYSTDLGLWEELFRFHKRRITA